MAISLLSLSACEKSFDEKYQDNLDQMNEEAKAIECGVRQHLTEGRKADQIMESTGEPEDGAEKESGAP